MEELIDAVELAKQVEVKNIHDFTLKNPLKLNPQALKLVLNQINFTQKIEKKVNEWFQNKNLIGPPSISVEQCSSEFTAKFKQNLFKGKLALDLTAGIGVDSYFLSKSFNSFIYNELNTNLNKIAQYNFNELGVKNVIFKNQLAENLITETTDYFDLVFIDPARRDSQNRKMVRIEDCEPNILELHRLILTKSDNLLIKLSPLLDLKLIISTFECVHKIYILAEKNEVKEILVHLTIEQNQNPEIVCINENKKLEKFSFYFKDEENINLTFDQKNEYLYEPNAAIMKGGAFKSISKIFNISKLAINSHLYTSTKEIENFPGRGFKIIKTLNFDKNKILAELPEKKANISCRNFIKTTEEVKKHLKISEGGNKYLFFSENNLKEKIVFICDKLA